MEETSEASPSLSALNWNSDDKHVMIPAAIRYIQEVWSIFPISICFFWKSVTPHDTNKIMTACTANARFGSTFRRPAFERTMAQAALSAANKENMIHILNFVVRLQRLSHGIDFLISCSLVCPKRQCVAL